jgi:hypothetical protein
VNYAPGETGQFSIDGDHQYELEDNEMDDGQSFYPVDVEPPPPQFNACPGPWYPGTNSVSVSGSGFTGQAVSIYGNGVDSNTLSVMSDTLIQGSVQVNSGIVSQTSVSLVVGDGACTVVLEPAPPPQLSCSPQTVTRGDSITCTVSSATVTQWSFSGGGFAPISGPTSGSTWTGPMVVSGTVSAAISGFEDPLTQTITVNARSGFSAVPMPSPQQVTNGWSQGDFQLATLPQDNPTQPSNLGNSTYAFFYTYSAYHPDSGPNNGLYIVYAANGQSTLNDTSMYPWELSPALLNSSSAFYQAQSGSCWSGVPALISSIQSHEAGPSSSHYSEVKAALDANNPGAYAEGFVGADLNDLWTQVRAPYLAARAAGATEPYTPPPSINFYPYQTCQ